MLCVCVRAWERGSEGVSERVNYNKICDLEKPTMTSLPAAFIFCVYEHC